ncbi:hypothetical protein, partial [Virgibacillus alimentarius]|uniref:hypothetical protein n=1 Tax=Virgibacillus alimentarius TaxID=698769 RepID=UPI001CF7C6F8
RSMDRRYIDRTGGDINRIEDISTGPVERRESFGVSKNIRILSFPCMFFLFFQRIKRKRSLT